MPSTADASFCAHCGLPAGRAARRREEGGEPVAFCCLGCDVAFRFAGTTAEAGRSRTALPLAQIALGSLLSMIVMLIQWVRYVEPEAAADPSYTEFAPWAQLIAATPVVLLLGVPYLWNALRWLREGRVGTDLLVGLGIFGGYAGSIVTMARGHADPLFFDTATGLATLVTVGRWLEASAKARATEGLRSFLSGSSRPARRVAGAQEEHVAADALRPGDRVRVLAGERIPADGVVEEGQALVDEAALTGEPLPRPVEAGQRVRAPTVPLDGPLLVRVEAAAGDTLLAEVGRVLDRARLERAPIERLADRVSAWFVPLVVLLALGVLAADLARGSGAADAWLHALSVLVIACPCALGIATPLAVTAALGRLAERGILVRSGAVLADLPRVGVVAFDKTGTLTEGRPEVGGVLPLEGIRPDRVLSLAASLEAASEHPWGRAIVARAREQGLPLSPARDVRVLAGRGIAGVVREDGADRTVRVGSARWLGVDLPAPGHVVVTVDDAFAGTIRLADRPRPSARAALEGLRAAKVEVRMLSGDDPRTVAELAKDLGLPADHAAGGLLPDEKVRAVQDLRERSSRPVAFVGDGLNDAPALAAADLSIAVGSGTDLAREAASVSLLGDDLARLPRLLAAARRTRRTAWLNLGWAFLYNLVALGWTVAWGLPPVFAALAMVLSSVFVVATSAGLSTALAADLAAPP
jgi:Cu2+-exporting ATPase